MLRYSSSMCLVGNLGCWERYFEVERSEIDDRGSEVRFEQRYEAS